MADVKKIAFLAPLWLLWLLVFAAFVLMLSGVSGMQSDCSDASANLFLGGGSSGYLAPVDCDRFFSYAWWTVFYDLIYLIILAVCLAAGAIYLFRGGLVGLTAINIMLAMNLTNTFLYYNNVTTMVDTFGQRARVTVAGGILKAIASFFILGMLGWKDESGEWEEGTAQTEPAGKAVGPTIEGARTGAAAIVPGKIKSGGTTTLPGTTTAAVPVSTPPRYEQPVPRAV
jgi:hypothetical protein